MQKISRQTQSHLGQSTQVVIENLEGRCMLSASPVSLDRHGLLNINGTRHSDAISITLERRHSSLMDVSVDGKVFTLKASKVHNILVSAGNGNDIITVNSNVTDAATLLGGAGDDTITAGGGDDHIDGGLGNDHCQFGQHSGVDLSTLPDAVQAGLTTLAQGATITKVQVFHDNGQTYYGTVVLISNVETRIVVDASGTPVSTGDNGEHHHEDGHRMGALVSVDAQANTITVMVGSEHMAPQLVTFNVGQGATITIDGVVATVANLAPGSWVQIQVSGTNPPTVNDIKAFGKRIHGNVTGSDTNANTITIVNDHGPAQTFNVDPSVVVMDHGVSGTLASVLNGSEVMLKFSGDNTTVVRIEVLGGPDDGGNHDGPPNGGGPGGVHHA